jgi:hypothetical protein
MKAADRERELQRGLVKCLLLPPQAAVDGWRATSPRSMRGYRSFAGRR